MTKILKVAIAALAITSFAGLAQAQSAGDPEKGKKVFKKCKACHMVGENAKKRVGPPLNNIMGAKAGAQEGFKFSKAMVKAGAEGLVWTEEKMDEFLKKPKKMIKGTKMSYGGLKKDKQRADVIAYLKTFSKPAE